MKYRYSRYEEGSALVLAILVMFSMLGLGIVAMRSTSDGLVSAGNLRITKQVRQVAEMGLYHAITLMNRESSNLLPLRDEPQLRESYFSIYSPTESAGEDTLSTVTLSRSDHSVVLSQNSAAPDILGGGTLPLGRFQETSGLIPSYRVRVVGFEPWTCPAGFDERALEQQGQGCCLMHFESIGRIAREPVTAEALVSTPDGRSRFAEYLTRAGVVLGPFTKRGCRR